MQYIDSARLSRLRAILARMLHYESKDPQVAVIIARYLGEMLCRLIAIAENHSFTSKKADRATLGPKIEYLRKAGFLNDVIYIHFNTVLHFGNRAVHTDDLFLDEFTIEAVHSPIVSAQYIVRWFLKKYADQDLDLSRFVWQSRFAERSDLSPVSKGLYDVTLDIGGSGLRICYFDLDQSQHWQHAYPLDFQIVRPLSCCFRAGESAAESILRQITRDPSVHIRHLSIGITGIVQESTVIQSDRIQELIPSFHQVDFGKEFSQLQGAPIKTWVHNDIHVIAKGITSLANIAPPSLICVLGTFPGIAVVDKPEKGEIQVHDICPPNIQTSSGERPMYAALSKTALQKCSEQEFVLRLSSLINQTLKEYYERFKWQPRTIVITGGEVIPFQDCTDTIQTKIILDKRWEKQSGYGRLVIINSYEQMCLAQARGALSFMREQ